MTGTIITYRPPSPAPQGGAGDFLGVAPDKIRKGRPEVTYSTNRTDKHGRKLPDGIELRFGDARPTEEVRAKLKEFGFRFSDRQVMWYARDDARARQFIDSLEVEEIELDTTVYEKHSFWAKVRSMGEYNGLRGRLEFMVTGSPPLFYNGKSELQRSQSPASLVASGRLKFKKYWSKAVEDGGESPEGDGDDGGLPDEGDNDDDKPGEDEGHRDDDPGEDGGFDEGGGDMAAILHRAASSMQAMIDRKLHPAIANQNRTPRRQRIIDGLRAEGIQLELIQRILYALSSAWATGRIERHPSLKKVSRRGHVELLLQYRRFLEKDTPPDTIQESIDRNREALRQLQVFTRQDWFDAYQAIREVLGEAPAQDPEKARQREIAEMVDKVRFKEFPGFFPTPEVVVERMVDFAEAWNSPRILDPSAGIGSILDRIAESRGGETGGLEAIEIQPELQAILRRKGYAVVGSDFMDEQPPSSDLQRHEKILMNPPFEDGLDTEHFTHALGFLKTGGRLVALICEGAFYRNSNRDKRFRELLCQRNAWVSNPVTEAFKTAFRSTGVAFRFVVVNQDGTRPMVRGAEIKFNLGGSYWGSGDSGLPEPVGDDDLELLELEAEAELELLKMQVEELRRKEAINGLGQARQDKLEALRRRAWALMDAQDVMDFK